MHVLSMDEKHCALWRHVLLQSISDHSGSSSPKKSSKATANSLPSGVHDCTHILDVVGSTGRWYLEEEQQRMRRKPEEVEDVMLLPVYNDLALKSNLKFYHSFVRDVHSCGMLTATVRSAEGDKSY